MKPFLDSPKYQDGRIVQIGTPTVEIFPAEYVETGVNRYRYNPFIEALPKLEDKKDDFLTILSHYPPTPTDATRNAGEMIRIAELYVLNDLVLSFPEFREAAVTLTVNLRDAYVSRNPLTAIDRQRRHALIMKGKDGLPLPRDWKSSALGHGVMAISGSGKSTFASVFLLRYPQVIRHRFCKGEQERYKGYELNCYQVVYVVIRIPHDGTLRSLCVQFFRQIDRLLGTNYVRQARALRNIAPMAELMHEVATAASLGFLVVDELQNLKSARGEDAEKVLNLLSELIEKAGISLLVIATPAVQKIIGGSVRNARKLFSSGHTDVEPMASTSPQWKEFCDACWDYTFVQKKGRLDSTVRDAWHKASGGNTAFALLAFLISQRHEIGGREIVDARAFERTLKTEIAFLGPAISALRSKKPHRLLQFDDLLFDEKYRALRERFGIKPEREDEPEEEFEELGDSGAPKTPKSPHRTPSPKRTDEDPLAT